MRRRRGTWISKIMRSGKVTSAMSVRMLKISYVIHHEGCGTRQCQDVLVVGLDTYEVVGAITG